MIDFTCTACGHKQPTERPLHACPACELGGWNMWHAYPIVETTVLQLPPRTSKSG